MRVLLFDIDGTLLSSGGAGQAAMEQALESAFGITAPTEGISYAGRTDHAITSEMLAFHGVDLTANNQQTFYEHYLTHLPRHLEQREGLVLPGVESLLLQLQARSHCLLGLLTGNFQRGAEIKLSHYDLSHLFQFGGYGDVHHDRDDVAREALLQAKRVLGTQSPSEVWVIGDTPNDVKCARAIGARVLAVATGHFSVNELVPTEPDHLVADLSDVKAIVNVLSA